jgi:hypothetical protein
MFEVQPALTCTYYACSWLSYVYLISLFASSYFSPRMTPRTSRKTCKSSCKSRVSRFQVGLGDGYFVLGKRRGRARSNRSSARPESPGFKWGWKLAILCLVRGEAGLGLIVPLQVQNLQVSRATGSLQRWIGRAWKDIEGSRPRFHVGLELGRVERKGSGLCE